MPARNKTSDYTGGPVTLINNPAPAPPSGATGPSQVLYDTGANTDAVTPLGTGTAIDCNAGAFFTKTVTQNTTFTVANVPVPGTAVSFVLELTNGGAFTVTWWAGVKWASGVAPALTAAGIDVLGFYTLDGGTNWRGTVLGRGMA